MSLILLWSVARFRNYLFLMSSTPSPKLRGCVVSWMAARIALSPVKRFRLGNFVFSYSCSGASRFSGNICSYWCSLLQGTLWRSCSLLEDAVFHFVRTRPGNYLFLFLFRCVALVRKYLFLLLFPLAGSAVASLMAPQYASCCTVSQ